MSGIFTGRFAAIVATGAVGGRRKTTVINIAGRQPCRRFVATVARSLSEYVTGNLARSKAAVVTCGTTPRRHAGMAELCPTECLCGVACFAAHLGRQVRLRFHHIAFGQTQATGMATGTVLWCALEYAAHMT